MGLGCLLGALIPSLVQAFGSEGEITWRVASGAFSVLWVASATHGISRFRGAGVQRHAPRYLWLGPVAAIVGNVLLWWNVLLGGAGSAARYLVGLVLLLAFAGLSFIAAVFHGRRAPPEADGSRGGAG